MNRFSIQDIKRAILAQDGRNVEARRFVNMLIGGGKKETKFGGTEHTLLNNILNPHPKDKTIKDAIRTCLKEYQTRFENVSDVCETFYEELAGILIKIYKIDVPNETHCQERLAEHIQEHITTLSTKLTKPQLKQLEVVRCPDPSRPLITYTNCIRSNSKSISEDVEELPEDEKEKIEFIASARLALINFFYLKHSTHAQLTFLKERLTSSSDGSDQSNGKKQSKQCIVPFGLLQLDKCMRRFDCNQVSKTDQLDEAIAQALPTSKEDVGYEELLDLDNVDVEQICEHFKNMKPQFFNDQMINIVKEQFNNVDDTETKKMRQYVEQAQAYFGGISMYPSQCSRIITDREDKLDNRENTKNKILSILRKCGANEPKQAKCYLHKLYASIRLYVLNHSDDDESSESESSDDANNNDESSESDHDESSESDHDESSDDESRDDESRDDESRDDENNKSGHDESSRYKSRNNESSDDESSNESNKGNGVSGGSSSRLATLHNICYFIRDLYQYDSTTPNNITKVNNDSIRYGYPKWIFDKTRERNIAEIKSFPDWFGPPGLDVRDIFMSDIGTINAWTVKQPQSNIKPKNIVVFHKMDCLVETNTSCKEECRYVLQTVPFYRYPNKDIVVCDFENKCVWKMKPRTDFTSVSFNKADKRTRRLIKMARQKYEARQNKVPDPKAIASFNRRLEKAKQALEENSSASKNMEGGAETGLPAPMVAKSGQGPGNQTGHTNTGQTPELEKSLEKSLEKVEKIIKARHVPCETYHEAAKQLEEGIEKYYKHPFLENQIRKGIDLLERLYNVREKQRGAPTGKRPYNRCFSLTGKTMKLGKYEFKIHKPMKGPRKNGRPKKTKKPIDPNKPKRPKRVRLQPEFCDWKNKKNEVSEKGLLYKACKTKEDNKRRPCGVKRKGNWILYNRGPNCTVVKRGEKWGVKNENNALQAYQVKKPTTTNAPKSKRPRRTKAPEPSAKPLASSKQDQDQVSGDSFAKILGIRPTPPGSKSPGLGLGPIDEEELNGRLANNIFIPDPVDPFSYHIGQRNQSAIPSDLSDEWHSLNLNTNFDKKDAIPSATLGKDASLNALLSSKKDKVHKDHVRSQPTSDVAAQLSPTPSPSQRHPKIDFTKVDVENLDPDVSEMLHNVDVENLDPDVSEMLLDVDVKNLDQDVLDLMNP